MHVHGVPRNAANQETKGEKQRSMDKHQATHGRGTRTAETRARQRTAQTHRGDKHGTQVEEERNNTWGGKRKESYPPFHEKHGKGTLERTRDPLLRTRGAQDNVQSCNCAHNASSVATKETAARLARLRAQGPPSSNDQRSISSRFPFDAQRDREDATFRCLASYPCLATHRIILTKTVSQ